MDSSIWRWYNWVQLLVSVALYCGVLGFFRMILFILTCGGLRAMVA